MLSLFQPIPGATKIKNVALFYLNENPLESSPFSVEVTSLSVVFCLSSCTCPGSNLEDVAVLYVNKPMCLLSVSFYMKYASFRLLHKSVMF